MAAPRAERLAVRLGALGAAYGVLAVAAAPALAGPECGAGQASAAALGKPDAGGAWRARVIAPTPLWQSIPRRGERSRGSIMPRQASWLLVLRTARDGRGGCWLRVRLPSRPNHAAAWINGDRVVLGFTRWRLIVSRAARTISVYRGHARMRRFRVVIGAAATPTPHGLFSIVDVWRLNPEHFLGSYILSLSAHSNVLQEFGGGEGRVGIHGRGGASLLDPLGSARSHGCIRLTNGAVEWLVREVGAGRLPGIPVRVS